jgi:transcriptional regulator with XRE-family HTH domain
MDASPGDFLKALRVQLHLGMRDVQKLSSKIAARERNRRFYISAARLSQIESGDQVPSQFKIFALAAIYGLSYYEILSLYGVDPDRTHRYRSEFRLAVTHPVSSEVGNLDARVTIPVRLDPSFKWETTQLINRVVALWGEIPAAFLFECSPKHHTYAYIGIEDQTMYPLLRPGSLVMVDVERRQVVGGGWHSEYDRPIYLVELRDAYLCGWCQVWDSQISIIPHPTSGAAVKTFNVPTEAEVIGQVVGVAMRLVPQARTNQAPATEHSAPS